MIRWFCRLKPVNKFLRWLIEDCAVEYLNYSKVSPRDFTGVTFSSVVEEETKFLTVAVMEESKYNKFRKRNYLIDGVVFGLFTVSYILGLFFLDLYLIGKVFYIILALCTGYASVRSFKKYFEVP